MQDERWITHTVKNFLRINKGKGFKEVIFKGSKGQNYPDLDERGLCLDITYSEFFLNRLRSQLLQLDDQISQSFLNSVFNTLNEATSEVLIMLR